MKECVTKAIAAGVTSRAVFEADGKVWMCGKCGRVKRGLGTYGAARDTKWYIWCQNCMSAEPHIRPEVLYDLLVE